MVKVKSIWTFDYQLQSDLIIKIPRIRWWPLLLIACWLAYNVVLVLWIMAATVAGRTVMFAADPIIHAPFLFILDLIS